MLPRQLSAALKAANSRLDYFRFHPFPRPQSGVQVSSTGTFGTLLLLLCLLGYMTLTLVLWFEAPLDLSLRQEPVTEERMAMVPTCFRFPNLTQASWFRFQLQRVRLSNDTGRVVPGSSVDIPLYTQNSDSVCIEPSALSALESESASLYSYCNPGACDVLRFTFWACGTPRAPPALVRTMASRSSSACADTATIAAALEPYTMTVAFETAIGVADLDISPSVTFSTANRAVFNIQATMRKPNYFDSFRTHQDPGYLVLQHSTSSLLRLYPKMFGVFTAAGDADNHSSVAVPDGELFTLDMQLSPSIFERTISQVTVLDLVSRWGAFFGVVAGTLRLVFWRYNRLKFYERHPSWTIDDHPSGGDAEEQEEDAGRPPSATSDGAVGRSIFTHSEEEKFSPPVLHDDGGASRRVPAAATGAAADVEMTSTHPSIRPRSDSAASATDDGGAVLRKRFSSVFQS